MSPLSCIIVDDELKSRENLRILVQDFCEDVVVLALCSNIAEATSALKQNTIDLVFLDIQMQRESGFDLFSKIEAPMFDVVFTTAHAEYAIKAFKFSALDYLLKPIDIAELNACIERARSKKQSQPSSASSPDPRFEQLVLNLKNTQSQNYKLALPTNTGLIFVKVSDILYCEASSNYTNIYFSDGKKHMVTRTLKEYEDLLTDCDFFRIHNSYLVNMSSVKQYIRGEGGQIVLSNNQVLDVSKRKKESFLRLFSK
ncbi:MAG: LytR/AlgR family response regulator transcription factor [Cyclobacteriaceae bacterium]|jgi:two-component system LytT family response regulator